MELCKVWEHLVKLLEMLKNNRINANKIINLLFTDAKSIA